MADTFQPQVFTFSRTAGGSRGNYVNVSQAEHELVDKELSSGKFANKSQAIEYLVSRGWSDGDIARKIVRDKDGKEPAGSPISNQFVNQVRHKWMAKQADTKTTPAPGAIVENKSELRKS